MQKILFPVDAVKYDIMQFFGKVASPVTEAWYRELGFKNGWHNGIDFACPQGTELIACFDGVIKNTTSSDGNQMCWVYGVGMADVRMHCSKFLKKDGDRVYAGEVIALSGGTPGTIGAGKYTTGAHLHYGLYLLNVNGQFLNPNNGLGGAENPAPYLALELENDAPFKNKIENKVFVLKNGKKWWVYDEETYLKWRGVKVGTEPIQTVDLITYNFYPYGGIIGVKK